MEIRRCRKCNVEKEVTKDNFYLRKTGWSYECRECAIKRHREYNNKNRELINAKNRVYNARPEVKAHKSEYKKKYRAEHKEELKIKDAEYRNREKSKQLKHQYYLKNKIIILSNTKKNYEEHKKEYADKQREKRQTDDVYRLKNNVRKAIRFALKFNDIEKCKRTEEVTKLRIDNLKAYLLKTFKDRYGYEWNDTEKVEVDHIIPLNTAKTKEEVLALCHYTNLQLLRKEDNLKKAHYILEAIWQQTALRGKIIAYQESVRVAKDKQRATYLKMSTKKD